MSEVKISVIDSWGSQLSGEITSWVLGGNDNGYATETSGGVSTLWSSKGEAVVQILPVSFLSNAPDGVTDFAQGAPVVDGKVVLSDYGCWNAQGMTESGVPNAEYLVLGAAGLSPVKLEVGSAVPLADFAALVATAAESR